MGIYNHKKHKESRQYQQAVEENSGEPKRKGWRTPYGFGDFTEYVTYQEACDIMKSIYENFKNKIKEN